MRAKEHYSTAMYLRLSREDRDPGGGRAESNSIRSQRDLIQAYIRAHREFELYDIYSDDGYSGANFDRPQFRRMMQDVEAGRIDCIIVKDLSRFGRDYIEAGRLIQKVLPSFQVRFIAVTDHFDSLTADYHEASLVVPVKNFVNDAYSRDISQKVKSHQRIKREKGDFIGAFTVYGYKKSPEDKNKLIPDAYAAGIVRQIFDWRLAGMSMSGIAKRLDERGILPPLEYKRSNGERFHTGFAAGETAGWSAAAVKRILNNEIYTGVMVQGKGEVRNHKQGKIQKKPPEEWSRVPDTHEAVISREIFERVRKLAGTGCRPNAGSETAHIFTGILFCGDCGRPLIRRLSRGQNGGRVSFICPTRNRGQGCSRHRVREEEMKTVLLFAMRQQAALFADREQLLARLGHAEVDFGEIGRFRRESERLCREQEKYMSLQAGLYEDWKTGILTKADFESFRAIYEAHCRTIREMRKKQEEELGQLFKNGLTAGIRLAGFRERLTVDTCSRQALIAFIERIDVYEGKRLKITWKCRDAYEHA